MAYTPLNVAAFVAAYSGAVAGMTTNQAWLDVADFIPEPGNRRRPRRSTVVVRPWKWEMARAAGAYAQALDALWDDPADLSMLEADTISSLTEQAFAIRSPISGEPEFNHDPLSWLRHAEAVVAIVRASVDYFTDEGLSPGPEPLPPGVLDVTASPPLASSGGPFPSSGGSVRN